MLVKDNGETLTLLTGFDPLVKAVHGATIVCCFDEEFVAHTIRRNTTTRLVFHIPDTRTQGTWQDSDRADNPRIPLQGTNHNW